VRFQEIEEDETHIYLLIESPTLSHNLCGDRALNSAPNGIKSSIVLKSGDRARYWLYHDYTLRKRIEIDAIQIITAVGVSGCMFNIIDLAPERTGLPVLKSHSLGLANVHADESHFVSLYCLVGLQTVQQHTWQTAHVVCAFCRLAVLVHCHVLGNIPQLY